MRHSHVVVVGPHSSVCACVRGRGTWTLVGDCDPGEVPSLLSLVVLNRERWFFS